MSLTSAIQNSSGATPAIKAVSGKAASPISASDISSLLNGSGDASTEVGKGEASATPRLYGPNNSLIRSKAARNQQVTNALGSGTPNTVENRTPRLPPPDGVGTPNPNVGSTYSFGDIGTGAAGDGRGVNGLANQFGLLPSLLAAQLQGSFGGPPPGMGMSNPLANLNFGDMGGASGSAKKKGSEETAQNNPPPQRVPPRDEGPAKDPLAKISQRDLDQSFADDRLLEKNRNLFGKDNKLTNKGEETLNQRFKDTKVQDNDNAKEYFNALKKNLNNAKNVYDQKKAIDTFRNALKDKGLDAEPVINKLFDVEDVSPQKPPITL